MTVRRPITSQAISFPCKLDIIPEAEAMRLILAGSVLHRPETDGDGRQKGEVEPTGTPLTAVRIKSLGSLFAWSEADGALQTRNGRRPFRQRSQLTENAPLSWILENSMYNNRLVSCLSQG